jgi:hypothetical protein
MLACLSADCGNAFILYGYPLIIFDPRGAQVHDDDLGTFPAAMEETVPRALSIFAGGYDHKDRTCCRPSPAR